MTSFIVDLADFSSTALFLLFMPLNKLNSYLAWNWIWRNSFGSHVHFNRYLQRTGIIMVLLILHVPLSAIGLLQVNFELYLVCFQYQIWLHWFCNFQGQFHLAKSSLRQALEVAHASILPFWQFKITFQLAVSVLRGDCNLLRHSLVFAF